MENKIENQKICKTETTFDRVRRELSVYIADKPLASFMHRLRPVSRDACIKFLVEHNMLARIRPSKREGFYLYDIKDEFHNTKWFTVRPAHIYQYAYMQVTLTKFTQLRIVDTMGIPITHFLI